jgi:hypothetical protein
LLPGITVSPPDFSDLPDLPTYLPLGVTLSQFDFGDLPVSLPPGNTSSPSDVIDSLNLSDYFLSGNSFSLSSGSKAGLLLIGGRFDAFDTDIIGPLRWLLLSDFGDFDSFFDETRIEGLGDGSFQGIDVGVDWVSLAEDFLIGSGTITDLPSLEGIFSGPITGLENTDLFTSLAQGLIQNLLTVLGDS